MSFKKKLIKTANIDTPAGSISNKLKNSNFSSNYYSDSSDIGSCSERASTDKPFDLSQSSGDSMDSVIMDKTMISNGHGFHENVRNRLPPSTLPNNGNNNLTASLAAQGFRRLQSTSSDDMTLSASDSESSTDSDSPKFNRQKKQRISSFSTKRVDGIAAMSPRVSASDFFMPLPQDVSSTTGGEEAGKDAIKYNRLSGEDQDGQQAEEHNDDDDEDTLTHSGDESSLNLRDLTEMQTKVLIFEYFGSMDNYMDKPRSQATTPSNGTFKVTGQDLMFIEEVNDIKELGFQELPMVKLRRAVQEIKIWRAAKGVIPAEVANFILSRCPVGTPKAADAHNSMAAVMNANGLAMPAPINTSGVLEMKNCEPTSSHSSASSTPARMSPQVITPVASKSHHHHHHHSSHAQSSPRKDNKASSASKQSTDAQDGAKISVDEQIYIILCKKKFQEYGLQLPPAVFSSSNDSSSDRLPVSDVAFRAVESRYNGLSPWTTMILVLSTNTQFEELTKFMCKAFGALYRANAITAAAAAGGANGHVSPSSQVAQQRQAAAASNGSTLQGEEMASLCRLLFDLLRIYMSNAEVVSLILKSLVCVIQTLLTKIIFLLVGNDFVTIVSIMAMYKSDPIITAQILPVLQNLLRLKEVKMILFDAGIVDHYVEILSIHKTSMSLVKQVVTAMKMLATTEYNQLQFSQAKTCLTLVETLNYHKSNASMVKPICSAIWNISMPKATKSLMTESGGCELLTEVLRLHQHNSLPMNQILGAIWTLSLLPANQEVFGSLGVCELLLQILQEHKQVVAIVDQACGAIANLADHAENHRRLVSNGVCDLLMEVLKNYSTNPSIAETACGAMGSIIENDKEGITSFTTSSLGCELIVSALIQHMTVPETVRQICSALRGKLTASPQSAALNESTLRGLGLNELLVIALNTHLSTSVTFVTETGQPMPAAGMQVMKPVLSVMKAMIQIPENCAKVILAQAIEALQKCLEVFCTFVDLPLVGECLDVLELLINGLSSSAYLMAVKEKSSTSSTPSLVPLSVPTSGKASAATQKNLIVFNTMLAVISMLKDHSEIVLKCLLIMKKTGTTSPTVMPPGTAGPVITLLVHLLPLHNTSEPVINQICWLIVSMGQSALNQVDMIALRFPMILLSLLARHIASPSCVLHIAWVIANTCYNKVDMAKAFLEESVVSPQTQTQPQSTGTLSFSSVMAPPAPKCKLMPLLSKAIVSYHSTNTAVVKYICHILLAITSFPTLLVVNNNNNNNTHSLTHSHSTSSLVDKKALYQILQTLFPKYSSNKNILKPLCGIVKNLFLADMSSVSTLFHQLVTVGHINMNDLLTEAKGMFEGEDDKLVEDIDFVISSLDLAEMTAGSSGL